MTAFSSARDNRKRGIAGNHDAIIGGERLFPGRARHDPGHARFVLVRRHLRRGRIEAREAVELRDRAHHHEAVDGVEVRLAAVLAPALVGKREGIFPEADRGGRRGPSSDGVDRGTDAQPSRIRARAGAAAAVTQLMIE